MQTSTEINKEEIFKENSLKNLYNNFKNKSNDIVHNHNSLIIIFSFILTIYPIFFNDKANIVYETTKELENKSKETYLIKVKNILFYTFFTGLVVMKKSGTKTEHLK